MSKFYTQFSVKSICYQGKFLPKLRLKLFKHFLLGKDKTALRIGNCPCLLTQINWPQLWGRFRVQIMNMAERVSFQIWDDLKLGRISNITVDDKIEIQVIWKYFNAGWLPRIWNLIKMNLKSLFGFKLKKRNAKQWTRQREVHGYCTWLGYNSIITNVPKRMLKGKAYEILRKVKYTELWNV